MSHIDWQASLHSRRLWLSVVSAVLLVLGRGLGVIPSGDATAIYGAAAIVVSLVLGDAYVQGKHAAATASTAATTAKPSEATAAKPAEAAPAKGA